MNKIIKILAVVLLIGLTLSAGGNAEHVRVSAQHKDIKQFMVGVLKADGTLVPFAEYRRGVWWNPWPEPTPSAGNDEVGPRSLGGHLEPWFQQCEQSSTTWYFWSAADSPLVLKTSGALQVENHAQTNWALMTDYPKKQTAEKDLSHDYVGMTLNVDLKVDSMVETERGSGEENNIVAYVTSAFNSSETAEMARLAATPDMNNFLAGSPSSSEQRAKTDLTVRKLYRNKSSRDGQHIYYIDVEKQYKKFADSRDSSCDNVAVLKGWLLKDKDGALSLLNDSFGLTDCDGKDRGSGVEWFSVLTLNDRTFLLTIEHGWEDESYTIYELKNHGLTRVLETFGG